MLVARTFEALRERERERELYFNKIKYSLFSNGLFTLDSNEPINI